MIKVVKISRNWWVKSGVEPWRISVGDTHIFHLYPTQMASFPPQNFHLPLPPIYSYLSDFLSLFIFPRVIRLYSISLYKYIDLRKVIGKQGASALVLGNCAQRCALSLFPYGPNSRNENYIGEFQFQFQFHFRISISFSNCPKISPILLFDKNPKTMV